MNRNFTTAIAVLAGVAAFTVLGNATVFKPAVNAPESKTMINASKMPAGMRAPQKDPTTGLPGNIEAADAETFEATLDSQEDFDRMITINTKDPVIGNGKGWFFSPYAGAAAILNYFDSEDYDEWLITPALQLEAGKQYTISFKLPDTDSWFTASKMEVKAGAEPTREAMTEVVFEPFTFIQDSEANKQCGYYFVPSRTGTYHIGFHAMGKSGFQMSNLRISSPGAVPIPSEDEIRYEEEVLMEKDLTTLTEGTMESPKNIVNSFGQLEGLDGWIGYEVYSVAGEGLLIKNSLAGTGNGAALIPAFVDTKGYGRIRYSVDYTTPEFSSVITGMDWIDGYLLLSSADYAPTVYYTDKSLQGFMRLDEEATANWICDIPSEPKMLWSANGDGTQYGEHNIDRASVYLRSACYSNLLVRKITVTGLTPVLDTPANARVEKYADDKATIAWDAVDGATEYVVRVYSNTRCNGNTYDLGSYQQYRLNETSVEVPVNVEKSATIVELFALGKKTRSVATSLRVIDMASPEFNPITEDERGNIRLDWEVPANNILTQVNVLKGEEVKEATDNYVVAALSAADMEDRANAGNLVTFEGQDGTWTIEGSQLAIENGAITMQNTSISQMLVNSNCAYDFSGITGNVKVRFSAKADGPCLVKVAAVDVDDNHSFGNADYKYVTLTEDYADYEVELTPVEATRFELLFGGLSTVYFKDLTVTCGLPAGAIFYKPVLSRNVSTNGKTTGSFAFKTPAAPFKNLMVWGVNVRYEYYDAKPTNAVFSRYSKPVYLEKELGIESVAIVEEAEAQPVYYNLHGMRINNAQNGAFIKVTGDKVEKIIK